MGFWSRLGDELSGIGNAIISAPGDLIDGVSSAGGTVWSGVSTAGSWVWDKGGDLASGAWDVITHPIESAQTVGEFMWWATTNPGEYYPLLFQGVLNAGASTVGIFADGVGNILSAVGNGIGNITIDAPLSVINFGSRVLTGENLTEFEHSIPYQGFWATTGLTALANRTGIVERIERNNMVLDENGEPLRDENGEILRGAPLNGFQRFTLFGGQAVAEIPAFIAATAFTGGVGGAAWVGIRGSAYAGRAAYAGYRGNQVLRTAYLAEQAALPAVTRGTLTEGFRSGAGAAFRWADPRHGTFNRVAEAGGAGLSFYFTSEGYRQEVEQGRDAVRTFLGAGDEEASAAPPEMSEEFRDALAHRARLFSTPREDSVITDPFASSADPAPAAAESVVAVSEPAEENTLDVTPSG